jgi:ribosomal protein L22
MSPKLPSRRSKDAPETAAVDTAAVDTAAAETDAAKAPAEATEQSPEQVAAAEPSKTKTAAPRTKASSAKPAQTEASTEADGEAPKPKRTRAKSAPAAEASKKAPAAKASSDDKAKSDETQSSESSEQTDKPSSQTDKAVPVARRSSGGSRAPGQAAPVVMARARYVRTSPRKARMVCGHLRGKSVPEARAMLAYTQRGVARDWSKLLESAVANAAHNHELPEDDLVVREAYADAGPTIKRFRPRALGRATPILKRTSHLTIKLTVGN